MIRSSFAAHVGMRVTPASQMAKQADGVTPLHVTGEVHCTLLRSGKTFALHALVVEQLDVDILAGNPFENDIATRPAKKQIIIDGKEVIHYGPPSAAQQPHVRRAQATVLRSPS